MSIAELAQANASTWMQALPASEEAIAELQRQVGFDLPEDYLDFLGFSNGGCGDLPVNPWCFDSLWTAEDMIECNRDYQVSIYCPGFFGIGSSGGGEMFAFDVRRAQPWPVVIVPFIGMEPKAAIIVAKDFHSFVAMFGCHRNDKS
jgi:SMI1 / KNR4 family (SUKH-1)